VRTINKEWHEANKMAKNASFEQRVEWHRAHLMHCACRSAPPDIAKRIEAGDREKNVAP
jgi:hypothetical protein